MSHLGHGRYRGPTAANGCFSQRQRTLQSGAMNSLMQCNIRLTLTQPRPAAHDPTQLLHAFCNMRDSRRSEFSQRHQEEAAERFQTRNRRMNSDAQTQRPVIPTLEYFRIAWLNARQHRETWPASSKWHRAMVAQSVASEQEPRRWWKRQRRGLSVSLLLCQKKEGPSLVQALDCSCRWQPLWSEHPRRGKRNHRE